MDHDGASPTDANERRAFDPDGRGSLATERGLAAASELDRLSPEEAFALFQAEDAKLVGALEDAREPILAATALVTRALRGGGRLLYVGAGTSGRLGVLDAVECPPTFQSDPDQVQGILAGGERAMFDAVEGAEDDEQAARRALTQRGVGPQDVVFGITAGGTTAFVHAALAQASANGAATVFLACVPFAEAPDAADVSIRILTGAEVLAGSTRLKAGTATKMALNRISTLAMVALGKVYGNRMVDLRANANAKLRARALRMLHELTGLENEALEALFVRADGQVKLAALMHARTLSVDAARERLHACGGSLRAALA